MRKKSRRKGTIVPTLRPPLRMRYWKLALPAQYRMSRSHKETCLSFDHPKRRDFVENLHFARQRSLPQPAQQGDRIVAQGRKMIGPWKRVGSVKICTLTPLSHFPLTISHVVLNAPSARLRKRLVTDLIELIAEDQVPSRPFRREPRAVKRRLKSYQLLNVSRHQMIEISQRSRFNKPVDEIIPNNP